MIDELGMGRAQGFSGSRKKHNFKKNLKNIENKENVNAEVLLLREQLEQATLLHQNRHATEESRAKEARLLALAERADLAAFVNQKVYEQSRLDLSAELDVDLLLRGANRVLVAFLEGRKAHDDADEEDKKHKDEISKPFQVQKVC